MAQLSESVSRCVVEYPGELSVEARELLSHLLTRNPMSWYDLQKVYAHPWFVVDN